MNAMPRPRGLSLVELMVGIAVGLLVAAAATGIATQQLGDQRRLLLETQIQQDLRNALDVIARDLQRAGHWAGADQLMRGQPNPFAAIDGGSGEPLSYAYDGAPAAGLRLRGGVVEMLMGGAGWQALTDASTLRVTTLDIDIAEQPVPLACAKPCTAGDAQCPPQLVLRSAQVRIAGQAVHEPALQRQASTQLRLRNDLVTGHCPT